MRVAMVDIGTNSTRLLIADVAPDGGVLERVRRSTVTRLGQGVDASGALAAEAMARVYAALDEYHEAITAEGVERNLAVLTSAVRDAANGAEFTATVRERYGLDAQTLTGDEEARLTFLGASSGVEPSSTEKRVVIDIGGGSTEFIFGHGREATFAVSANVGVVRMTERHIHGDPPPADDLADLADEARRLFVEALPAGEREGVAAATAVAGTATSLAAIDLELDPYDPLQVEGHLLPLGTCELLLARLAALGEADRRRVSGLHPDRAPTIVAGAVLLIEAMRVLELDEVQVSEHDILRGGALRLAGLA
jgi:exopolyphosphatase/guanosine-5'-triphosphate,3'-diphosphate pyrophosphatase